MSIKLSVYLQRNFRLFLSRNMVAGFCFVDIVCLIFLFFLFQSSNGASRPPFAGGVKPPMATQHQTNYRAQWNSQAHYYSRIPSQANYPPNSTTSANYNSTNNSVRNHSTITFFYSFTHSFIYIYNAHKQLFSAISTYLQLLQNLI